MGGVNGGFFVGDWTPPALVLSLLTIVVSLVGGFFGFGSRAGILAIGLLTAYTAWTFASIFWSPNMGDAWQGAGLTLLYLLTFWSAIVLIGSDASRRWVLAVSALGPAAIAALTLRALGDQPASLFTNSRMMGTVGYHNGEAAFLLVPFWLAIYLGGTPRSNPLLRGAVLAGSVLSLDLAILTQSRGGMVALGLSLPIFFLLSGRRLRGLLALVPVAVSLYVVFPDLNRVYTTLLQGESPAAALDQALPTVWLSAVLTGLYGLAWGLLDGWWRPPKKAVLAFGGLTLVCCVFVLATAGALVHERVENPVAFAEQKWEAFKDNTKAGQQQTRYVSVGGSGRYTMWKVAVEDFTAHPLLGIGTHNYEATYYRLRELDTGHLRQPHDLSLEVLAERGIVGGALFFGFLGVCVGTGLWRRFQGLHTEGKAQVGALLAAVTYWFAHSSAEWFWQLPAVTLPAFVYLALLVSSWRTSRHEVNPTPNVVGWRLRLAGAGMAVLSLVVIVPLYAADHFLQQSYRAGSQDEALAAVRRAQEFNPLDARLPQREAEIAMESGAWERVEEAYKREIQLAPRHYAPYMFLGSFYERRLELERASDYYKKALSLNPLDKDLKRSSERLENETGQQ